MLRAMEVGSTGLRLTETKNKNVRKSYIEKMCAETQEYMRISVSKVLVRKRNFLKELPGEIASLPLGTGPQCHKGTGISFSSALHA